MVINFKFIMYKLLWNLKTRKHYQIIGSSLTQKHGPNIIIISMFEPKISRALIFFRLLDHL